MLVRSRSPGCVIGWFNFLQQHAIFDNYLPILSHFPNRLDTSFSFVLYFFRGVEPADQFLLSS